jgi:peptide/nickel transport system permease protein
MAQEIAATTPKTDQERYYVANQWQLIWRRFIRHRLALVGGAILIVLYTIVLFCDFLAPNSPQETSTAHIYAPPQRIRFFDMEGRFHVKPFVYGYLQTTDEITWERIYEPDPAEMHPVRFFVRGHPYKLLGLIPTDIHLFGAVGEPIYLFGADELGRDLFSRTMYAARISLSIGLVGVGLTFILGCLLGGISGYFGGNVDLVIQRIIELLISIPVIPFWMGLSAALPSEWPPLQVYFGITVILSLIGWTSLARVVRGKLLELRETDFVMAARISAAPSGAIIRRHLLPGFMSYLIVSLTLSVPWMILGETSLSFLGLGLRPPVVSWGVLLKAAQNFRTVVLHPWMLIPGLFVIIAVLAFNFVGDGLRDAADPYK